MKTTLPLFPMLIALFVAADVTTDLLADDRRQPASTDQRLVGRWLLIDANKAFAIGDRVESRFTPDGKLIYSVSEKGTTAVMNLTYRAEAGVLFTDQPSSPRKERTRYFFNRRGHLVLDYGGAKSTYQRIR